MALQSLFRIVERYAEDDPEHGGNNTDGKRENCLDHITENRGGTGRKQRKTAVPLPEDGEQQQACEQHYCREAVICEL